MSEAVIRIVRYPSMVAILMDIAPLVRRGILTNTEGRWLANFRYRMRSVEIANGK